MRAPILALSLVVACVPATVPVPDPDGGPTLACRGACEGLRRAGCPEGSPTDGGPCEAVCERASRLVSYPLGCWADAGTADDVRACGGTRCASIEDPARESGL